MPYKSAMQRISQAYYRTFKRYASPIYFIIHQCTQTTFDGFKRFYQIPRQRIDVPHNIKFCSPSSPIRSTRILFAFGLAGLMKFLGLTEEKEDSELIQVIKKAEIAMIKKEYNKSEQLFHLALRIAQQLRNENGVTYIFDRLANIAFDTGKNERARKLFVSVMQRLLDQGMEKNNLILIHISFKLAKIFENVRDFRTAEIGFQYCIDSLTPKLTTDNPEYEDAIALWQMILNGYAYFLYNVGRMPEAFEFFQQSYDACVKIGGEKQKQVVLLLNNLGTVSKQKGNIDDAFSYFHKAEKLGKEFPDIDNFSFVYLNLAYLYMEKNMLTEAEKYCDRALINSKRHEYEEGVKESEECLVKVKEALQK